MNSCCRRPGGWLASPARSRVRLECCFFTKFAGTVAVDLISSPPKRPRPARAFLIAKLTLGALTRVPLDRKYDVQNNNMTAFVSSFAGAAVRPQFHTQSLQRTAPKGSRRSAAASRVRLTPRAMQTAGGGAMYDGARAGPPPDLPSLLLHNRIIYLGMSLVPAVTELIIAEFLYLQYEDASKPVYMYINSTGTSSADGQNVGFETEAFAVADTMNYVKMPVHTICVGQAFGMAAMLLASGEKTHRAALPNATIMLHQPRGSAQGQASDIAIKAKEVLYNRRQAFDIIAERSGQPLEQIEKDAMRTKYFTPQEAVDYGLIDKVLLSEKELPQKAPTFLSALDK